MSTAYGDWPAYERSHDRVGLTWIKLNQKKDGSRKHEIKTKKFFVFSNFGDFVFKKFFHKMQGIHIQDSKEKSEMKILFVIGVFISLSSCYNGMPYQDNGKYPEAEMVSVGLTHAVLYDDPQLLSQFRTYARNVLASMESQPGFIGSKTRRRISGLEVWTMTVWTSEEALNKFVRSDVHKAAIRNGLAAVKAGEFARTTIPRSEAPLSWRKANKLLKESPRKIYN